MSFMFVSAVYPLSLFFYRASSPIPRFDVTLEIYEGENSHTRCHDDEIMSVRLTFANVRTIGKLIGIATHVFSNDIGKNENMACQATICGCLFAAGDAPIESQLTNAIHHTNMNQPTNQPTN
jgi:hypothetical protein